METQPDVPMVTKLFECTGCHAKSKMQGSCLFQIHMPEEAVMQFSPDKWTCPIGPTSDINWKPIGETNDTSG